jgi:thioredoxin 1
MKKLSIYLGIIAALFALIYVLNHVSVNSNDPDAKRLYNRPASQLNQLTVKQLKDANYQNIILPEDLKKRVQNKESLFVYFFSPDCPHCVRTTPMLYPLSKQMNVDLKQLNLMEFKQEWTTYNIEYTPTLVYFKDGKEVERLVGENEEQKFKDFFDKYKKSS